MRPDGLGEWALVGLVFWGGAGLGVLIGALARHSGQLARAEERQLRQAEAARRRGFSVSTGPDQQVYPETEQLHQIRPVHRGRHR